MDVLRNSFRSRKRGIAPVFFLLLGLLVATTGCQITYLAKSAYSQANLLRKRVPIEEALEDPSLSDENKRKLKLAQEALEFSEAHLGLARTNNYTTYVQLDGPYVTYVVQAAQRNKLERYLYRYPLVGSMPYKGFFDPEDAKAEAAKLDEEGLDTYIRGVTAYSTLGWFRDPVLSSMLAYKDHNLVNTIIHETVHATVFIKSNADFNERLATFIGNKGTEAFYFQKEGRESKTLALMKRENEDDQLFGDFISKELDALEAWYKEREGKEISEEERVARLNQIHEKFEKELKPKFREPDAFSAFGKGKFNNARLLNYRLYFEDLSQFQKVFDKLEGDFNRMLEFARALEKVDDPIAELEKAAHSESR